MIRKRFTLPDGCTVAEFVVRELVAKDEVKAAQLADASGGADSDLQREMLRLSICEVDGVKVNEASPYFDMDQWSLRTLRYLQQAWLDLNGVGDSDLKNFEASAELVAESGATAPK